MKDETKREVTGEGPAEEAGSFLGRWSRRKIAAREGRPLAEPARPPDAEAAQRPAEAVFGRGAGEAGSAPRGSAPPELPSIDSLQGIGSEYRDFLRPDVDEGTRRAALKKLFADPHFHFDQMDGLDVYIDDYTKPDPIPAAMLRTLAHAKDLLFGGEKDPSREAPGHDPAISAGAGTTDIASQQQSPDPVATTGTEASERSVTTNDPVCPDVPRLSQIAPETKEQS